MDGSFLYDGNSLAHCKAGRQVSTKSPEIVCQLFCAEPGRIALPVGNLADDRQRSVLAKVREECTCVAAETQQPGGVGELVRLSRLFQMKQRMCDEAGQPCIRITACFQALQEILP